MAIQMDDSDSITVSEQSEPSAECWQNMYKLLNFYSLISDPTGILEKSSPENCLSGGNRPSAPNVPPFIPSMHYPFCFTLHIYLLYLPSTYDFERYFCTFWFSFFPFFVSICTLCSAWQTLLFHLNSLLTRLLPFFPPDQNCRSLWLHCFLTASFTRLSNYLIIHFLCFCDFHSYLYCIC